MDTLSYWDNRELIAGNPLRGFIAATFAHDIVPRLRVELAKEWIITHYPTDDANYNSEICFRKINETAIALTVLVAEQAPFYTYFYDGDLELEVINVLTQLFSSYHLQYVSFELLKGSYDGKWGDMFPSWRYRFFGH